MESEEEQLERLREWWKDNGRPVVIGLVVGLGGVFGWTSWQTHTERRAEQASIEYQKIADSVLREDHAGAAAQADTLIAEFPSSGYAPLAALLAARSELLAGRADDAIGRLEWTIGNAEHAAIRDVARVRLARLHLDAGRHAEAAGQLGAIEGSGFDAMVEEVRGDLAFARGDPDAARSAYTSALADEAMTPAGRRRLQMKLDDLGPAGSG